MDFGEWVKIFVENFLMGVDAGLRACFMWFEGRLAIRGYGVRGI